MENEFQASKNKRTFCLSNLCLQTAKLRLTRPMLKNCLSLKATRRSTSATCNQATKAHDKILDQAIVTQASRTSGPSKYDSCDYSLCENFTSHQRARIESISPNTRFKEHRLQSSVKTVQLWTIQQALGKTRFQASAHSQENTPDSNQANKCFSLWPKDQIALNCYQTQALRTTGSKQV